MKDNSLNLEKRLAGYTALAGIVIAAGPSAQAAIIKTDPADQSGLQAIRIDFNNDLTNDVDIVVGSYIALDSDQVLVSGLGSINPQVMGQLNSSYFVWNASVLNSGDTIGASKTFATCRPGFLMYGPLGSWAGKSEKFVGVRFKLGANTHYGWIKISCSSSAPYTLTIYEYAYDDTPNTAIQAGADGSLPVELSSFNAKYENNAVNLQWITESETDNLGFILERQQSGDTAWATVASYQTHAALQGQGTTTSRKVYAYSDANVIANQTYCYCLSDVDVNGDIISKKMIEITSTDATTPDQTQLLAAYPNPFNPGTTIQYRLADDAPVTLDVIDITGRTVCSIVKENQSAGSYSFAWDGMDNTGNSTPSGIYMLVLKTGSIVKTQKVTRLR